MHSKAPPPRLYRRIAWPSLVSHSARPKIQKKNILQTPKPQPPQPLGVSSPPLARDRQTSAPAAQAAAPALDLRKNSSAPFSLVDLRVSPLLVPQKLKEFQLKPKRVSSRNTRKSPEGHVSHGIKNCLTHGRSGQENSVSPQKRLPHA